MFNFCISKLLKAISLIVCVFKNVNWIKQSNIFALLSLILWGHVPSWTLIWYVVLLWFCPSIKKRIFSAFVLLAFQLGIVLRFPSSRQNCWGGAVYRCGPSLLEALPLYSELLVEIFNFLSLLSSLHSCSSIGCLDYRHTNHNWVQNSQKENLTSNELSV